MPSKRKQKKSDKRKKERKKEKKRDKRKQKNFDKRKQKTCDKRKQKKMCAGNLAPQYPATLYVTDRFRGLCWELVAGGSENSPSKFLFPS